MDIPALVCDSDVVVTSKLIYRERLAPIPRKTLATVQCTALFCILTPAYANDMTGVMPTDLLRGLQFGITLEKAAALCEQRVRNA